MIRSPKAHWQKLLHAPSGNAQRRRTPPRLKSPRRKGGRGVRSVSLLTCRWTLCLRYVHRAQLCWSVVIESVLQIFTHLFPADLLNLARSTKAFRELLMKKSSITIWRAARGNVLDLPDCPPDLSEPAYANLLFSNCCHVSLCRVPR